MFGFRKFVIAASALAGVMLTAGGASAAGIYESILNTAPENLRFKFSGATTETNTWAGTNETTWGVGKLTQIVRTSDASAVWTSGVGNDEEITFIIYGIADAQITPNGSGVNIYNVGAENDVGNPGGPADGLIHIDFYVDSLAASDTSFLTDGPAIREAYNKSGDWTDGTLLMQWVLDPGVVADLGDGGFNELLTTMFQQVSAATLPAEGDGQFFASCVGGLLCTLLDTNAFLRQDGGLSDFEGEFTLEAEARGLWHSGIDDPVKAVSVPEPASLTLFGAGMLAVGVASAIRARRQRKAA